MKSIFTVYVLCQTNQESPQCQSVPLVKLWRAVQWLWPAAVMLTHQCRHTPGTRRTSPHLNHLDRATPSTTSALRTVDSIGVGFRMMLVTIVHMEFWSMFYVSMTHNQFYVWTNHQHNLCFICYSQIWHISMPTCPISDKPRNLSVSVSPSGEVVEGSSVTLTCSSDANPPVQTYTWYKENITSSKSSGQSYTITNISSEDSGQYWCRAKNKIATMETHFVWVNVKCEF